MGNRWRSGQIHGLFSSKERTKQNDCCLFNPTSMEKIQLPPWETSFYFDACVLSLPPSDPSCILLFITNSEEEDEGVVSLRFSRPTLGRVVYHWIEQKFTLEDDRIKVARYFNGKIYAITSIPEEIFTFEVSDNTTAVLTVRKMGMQEKIPRPLLPEAYVTGKDLVESCGELYVVVKIYVDELMPREIQDIEVFKLDCTKKVWLRVESLGDRAFLLGPNCCTSCYASRESEYGIVGNTIYFTMKNDKSLYAMNLEDRSITVSLPCPNVKNNWSQPIWFN
ncbi:hypothetical protein LguiB_021214 [Lonicera macranthoides]